MENSEKGMMLNAMNNTYLEEVINAHKEHYGDDVEIVDKVLNYRKVSVPLKITLKDHH